jgi:cell division protein FtsB
MTRTASITVFLLGILLLSGRVSAQDAGEVAKLKREIELLKEKNELLTRENTTLKKEVAQLKAGGVKNPADKPADDAFAKAAVFEGRRQYLAPAQTQTVRLEITERDGTSFKGQLTIQNFDDKTKKADESTTRVVKVEGTAPVGAKGAVRFKTEKSGKFEQTFTGKLNNGAVGFEFSGSNWVGVQSSGSGEIKAR